MDYEGPFIIIENWYCNARTNKDNRMESYKQNTRYKIIEIKNESSNHIWVEMDNTDYSLWNGTRYIKKSRVQIPSIHKEDGTWAYNAQKKLIYTLDILNEYFYWTP